MLQAYPIIEAQSVLELQAQKVHKINGVFGIIVPKFRRKCVNFPGGSRPSRTPARRRSGRSSSGGAVVVGQGERPAKRRTLRPTTNAPPDDVGGSGGAGAPPGKFTYGRTGLYFVRDYISRKSIRIRSGLEPKWRRNKLNQRGSHVDSISD